MKLSKVFTCTEWVAYFQSSSFHRLMVSFWCSISFVGLGSSYVVFGPTLLDIANKLSVGVGSLAVMYFLRAVGSPVGSVLSGVAMDKFERYSYTILCVILISGFATTVIVPLSVHIVMLGVLMLLNGLALGSLDNGTHAILLKLWGDNAGPCMQILHFAFAFGAFLAPIIAKQFISEEFEFVTNSTDDNFVEIFNLTCFDITGETDTYLNINGDYENCLYIFNQTCNNLTNNFDTTVQDLLSDCAEVNESQFVFAFWISASMFVLPFVAFLYYSIRLEWYVKLCKGKKTSERQVQTKNGDMSKKKTQTKKPQRYLIAIFILLFSFMFFYVGCESAYGSFIFTFAVKSELHFSKSRAAVLAAVFWGTFAFTRLFSVIFALLKVKSSVLITCNILGSLIGVSILMFFPTNPTAVWIGSAVLGMSMAAIFPTVMTWMTENVPVSGKASAVVITGGNLGDIVLPGIVGALIAEVKPISFIYFSFVAVLLSAIIGAIMLITAGIQQGKTVSQLPNAKYKKLSNQEELLDSTEEQSVSNGFVTSVTLGNA